MTLTIPTDSLRNLPKGALYEKKSGQATLKIGYDNGAIVATASCDSLQQMVYRLEEELQLAYGRLEQHDTETKKEYPALTLRSALAGAIIILLTVLIYQFLQKWQRTF